MSLQITPQEFIALSAYIHDISGIVLDQSKIYLVETRLGPLLDREGMTNYNDLLRKARIDSKLRLQVIDAISTNETSFFRDNRPFDLLSHKIIPDHFERLMERGAGGSHSLNVWSAACSTGQEIYSFAIVLKELLFDLSKYNIHILGTDISSAALEIASSGKYGKLELSRGMSAARLQRHFSKEGDHWRIHDELRALAKYQRVNLLEPLNALGSFDIIMCRNVAIYFSRENRKILFERLADRLKPDGVLIIGSTESITGITDRLTRREFHNSPYYVRSTVVQTKNLINPVARNV